MFLINDAENNNNNADEVGDEIEKGDGKHLAGFEQKNGHLSEVEVDEMLRLRRGERGREVVRIRCEDLKRGGGDESSL